MKIQSHVDRSVCRNDPAAVHALICTGCKGLLNTACSFFMLLFYFHDRNMLILVVAFLVYDGNFSMFVSSVLSL